MVVVRVVGLVWCGLVLAAPAWAQSEMGVTTQLDPCVPVDQAQFQRLLEIELGTSAREVRPETATTRVEVGCVPAGLSLQLHDGVTRKSMRRVLPVEPLQGPAGARLLALAVAEFVVASWTELTVTPTPAVEPVGPALPPAVRERARRVVRRRISAAPASPWSWGLEGGLSGFVGHTGSPLAGGGVRLGLRQGPVQLRVSGQGVYGVEAVDPGRLQLGLASGRVSAGLITRLGAAELEVGLAGVLGLVLVRGQALDLDRYRGVSARAPIGAALVVLGGRYLPGSDLGIGLEFSGGLVTWPVELRAEGAGSVLELAGSWLGLSLVVDFGL